MRHQSHVLRWVVLLPAASALVIGLGTHSALARKKRPPRPPPASVETPAPPPAPTESGPSSIATSPPAPRPPDAVAATPMRETTKETTKETTIETTKEPVPRSRRGVSAGTVDQTGGAAGPTATASASAVPVRRLERELVAHVGVASPLVTVHATRDAHRFTSLNDDLTLVAPIGLGLRLTEALTFDVEFQVATGVRPEGVTSAVVDPGLLYSWGRVGAGLRVAWQLNENQNVGLIPLFNVGLVRSERATWFVEAAFPSFVQNRQLISSASLHTGVAF